MTRSERVRYEMLSRVGRFGAAHRELFPEQSSAGLAFALVAKVLTEIDQHVTAKLLAVREGRQEKNLSRTVMLKWMKSIARTSRGVRTKTGTLLGLQMPRRRSDRTVLAAARAFMHEAEEHRDQLTGLGLPSNCLTELRGAMAAFEAATAERLSGRSAVAGAQAGINAGLAAGADALRTLDIVVPNTLEHDPVLLAAWLRDRRVVGQWKSGATASTPTDEAPTEPIRRAS